MYINFFDFEVRASSRDWHIVIFARIRINNLPVHLGYNGTINGSRVNLMCTDKYSKKVFSIAIFLSRVLMHQKHQISLPVGYKTARPKTGDWERL